MRDFLKRHPRESVVLGLAGLALAGLALPESVSARARGGLGTVFAPAQAAVARAEGGVAALVQPLASAWRRGRRIEALEAEVERLRAENVKLLEQLAARERELADALVLKRTLPAAELEFIVAPVIGRDSCTWSKVIAVGRGRESGVARGQLVVSGTGAVVAAGGGDGVAEGDAVLDGARVVGHVAATGPFHSVVRLISDPACVMRAQVLGERDGQARRMGGGILTGSLTGRNLLRLDYVAERTDVRPGDVVMTAGYGGVLPAPLVVGRVESVASAVLPLLCDVTVRPEADLEGLRRVVIVRERLRRQRP